MEKLTLTSEIIIFWIIGGLASFFLIKNIYMIREVVSYRRFENTIGVSMYSLFASALPVITMYCAEDKSKALFLCILFFFLSVVITGFILDSFTNFGARFYSPILTYGTSFCFGIIGISIGGLIGVGIKSSTWTALLTSMILNIIILISGYCLFKLLLNKKRNSP